MRGRRGFDFSNENDGIDWENALPPHIVAQQRAAAPPVVAQPNRTMVFDWPLPEGDPRLNPPTLPRRAAAEPHRRRVVEEEDGGHHRRRNPSQRNTAAAGMVPLQELVRASDVGGSRRAMMAMRDQVLQEEWTGIRAPPPRVVQQQQQPPRRTLQPMPNPRAGGGGGEPLPPQQQQQQQSSSLLPVERTPQQAQRVATQRVVAPPPPPATNGNGNNGAAAGGGGGGGGEWELRDFSYEALLELGSLAVSTGLDKKQLLREFVPKPYQGKKKPNSKQPSSSSKPTTTTNATSQPHRLPSSTSPSVPPATTAAATTASGLHQQQRSQLPHPRSSSQVSDLLAPLAPRRLPNAPSLSASRLPELPRTPPPELSRHSSTVVVADERGVAEDDDETDCTVCLDVVAIGELCVTLPCHHVFHPNCILKWLARSNKCPTCRFEIVRR